MASEASDCAAVVVVVMVEDDDDGVGSVGVVVVVGSMVSMLFSNSHLCCAIDMEFGSIFQEGGSERRWRKKRRCSEYKGEEIEVVIGIFSDVGFFLVC